MRIRNVDKIYSAHFNEVARFMLINFGLPWHYSGYNTMAKSGKGGVSQNNYTVRSMNAGRVFATRKAIAIFTNTYKSPFHLRSDLLSEVGYCRQRPSSHQIYI